MSASGEMGYCAFAERVDERAGHLPCLIAVDIYHHAEDRTDSTFPKVNTAPSRTDGQREDQRKTLLYRGNRLSVRSEQLAGS